MRYLRAPADFRFWEKVKISKEDGCWIWQAARTQKGYGSFRLSTKEAIGAHRYSYLRINGKLPNDIPILHNCDNKLCVNPRHLFVANIEARFNKRIKVKKPNECWEWFGSRDQDGYGYLTLIVGGRRYTKAHRIAYQLKHKVDIPENMVVMHTCDNPPCVNWRHLKLGTNQDNIRDRELKNRTYRKNPKSEHN